MSADPGQPPKGLERKVLRMQWLGAELSVKGCGNLPRREHCRIGGGVGESGLPEGGNRLVGGGWSLVTITIFRDTCGPAWFARPAGLRGDFWGRGEANRTVVTGVNGARWRTNSRQGCLVHPAKFAIRASPSATFLCANMSQVVAECHLPRREL